MQMNEYFITRNCGKWVLCGEHAVLRGSGAIVFPLKSLTLTLEYIPRGELANNPGLVVDDDLDFQYVGVGDQARLRSQGLGLIDWVRAKYDLTDLDGLIRITNQIPVKSGLGSSAALAVSLAQLIHQTKIITPQIIQTATTIEDYYHGQSSGLDIHGVVSQGGVYFQQGRAIQLASNLPCFTLSHSREESDTKSCIDQVATVRKTSPEAWAEAEQGMRKATAEALSLINRESDSLTAWQAMLVQANTSFAKWGLLTPGIIAHQQQLQEHGAAASKPTGSGQGGYVLALWPHRPDPIAGVEFVYL